MIIDGEKAKAVEAQFKAIYTNKEEVKDLNARNTEMFNAIAETLNMKKKAVRVAYKAWSEQFEEGADSDLESAVLLVNAIQGE